MATLLGFSTDPSREALMEELVKKGILAQVTLLSLLSLIARAISFVEAANVHFLGESKEGIYKLVGYARKLNLTSSSSAQFSFSSVHVVYGINMVVVLTHNVRCEICVCV